MSNWSERWYSENSPSIAAVLGQAERHERVPVLDIDALPPAHQSIDVTVYWCEPIDPAYLPTKRYHV